MAYSTGTADNYTDLLERLEAFLTADPDLVAAGRQWTTLRFANGVSPQALPWGRVSFGTSTSATILDNSNGVFNSSNLAVKVTGQITLPETGDYIFAIDSDNSAELKIDGAVRVGRYVVPAQSNNWSSAQTIPMTAGTYSFEVTLTSVSGTYGVSVGWQLPSEGAIGVIPAANLNSLEYTTKTVSVDPTTSSAMASLWTERELWIKAPGHSGSEEIFIGIRPYQNFSSDYYNWELRSALGYNPAAAFDAQPGISPASYSLMWNSQIKYWFFANGQKVIVVAKVSTTYHLIYLGKYLPYALPSQYPYPVIVSGSTGVQTLRWSNNTYANANITGPNEGHLLCDAGGVWRKIRHIGSSWYSAGNYLVTTSGTKAYSGSEDNFEVLVWPRANARSNWNLVDTDQSWPDGSYTLLPFILFSLPASIVGSNKYGEIEDIKWVSGHLNAPENVITVDGEQYICFNNIFRSNNSNYFAVRII